MILRFLQEYSAFCFGKSKKISTEKSKTLGEMSDNKEYFQKTVKNGFSYEECLKIVHNRQRNIHKFTNNRRVKNAGG